MSATDSLDQLGVLLEQLEGLGAVGTQASFGELTQKETRFYMYSVHDYVLRANAAYMDFQEARTDAHLRQQAEQGAMQ